MAHAQVQQQPSAVLATEQRVDHTDALALARFGRRYSHIIQAAAAIVLGELKAGQRINRITLALRLRTLSALSKVCETITENRMADLITTANKLGAFEGFGFEIRHGVGFALLVRAEDVPQGGGENVYNLSVERGRKKRARDELREAAREAQSFKVELARLRKEAKLT